MNKKTPFFLSIILITLTISTIYLTPVNATDYNWVQDYSFEDNASSAQYNVLVDSGFEADRWIAPSSDGNYYGGWFNASTWTYKNYTDAYEGNICLYGKSGSSCIVRQYLFVNYSVSDIVNLSLYVKASASNSYSCIVTVLYNDTTTDVFYCEAVTTDYQLYNFTENLTVDKFIRAVYIQTDTTHSPAINWYVDNVHLDIIVYNPYLFGNIIDGNSYPWYTYWYSVLPDSVGTDYIGISSLYSHTGSYSAYIVKIPKYYQTIALKQQINYLTSENISSMSLYAKTNSISPLFVSMWLYFADGTGKIFTPSNGTQIDSIVADDGWSLINFNFTYPPNAMPTGKIIRELDIFVSNGDTGSTTYIDDVSIIANVEPVLNSRFSYYTTPEPIQYTSLGFEGVCLQSYNLYAQFNDVNGTGTDFGDFTVTSQYQPTITGVVVAGEFHFTISERPLSYVNKAETLEITLDVTSGTYKFSIFIVWVYDTSNIVPTPPVDIGASQNMQNVMNWIIICGVTIAPAILFAFAITEHNQNSQSNISPMLGAIAGLVLSIGIGVFTGILPIWLIFLILVVVAILIFGEYRGGHQ